MLDKNKKMNIFNNIPKEGFIKIPVSGNVEVNSKERVLLIRKANELMNQKNFLQAKKIYLAIGYSAGLIRIGEYYENNGEIFEALKMYKAAEAKSKLDQMTKKMADVVKVWIKKN